VILRARAGHAMLLDCATGAIDHVPVPASVGFVIVDTGTRRALADGRYGQRRAEVEAGHPKRVEHARQEQRRVYEAAEALRAGDVVRLGSLLSEGHGSLRDLYEVSSPALDEAVAVAVSHPACTGARLVGAGFAGCVLAVVEGGREEEVCAHARSGLRGSEAFAVRPVDGAGEVSARPE
jgi:galactokinase